MATLLIRNLDDSLKEALRRRAAANRRSMEEEARQILQLQLRSSPLAGEGLGTRIARIWAEAGGVELEIPPRTMPRRPPFMDDDEPWP